MSAGRTPLRLLVVLPSWVGDTVMATPTLRRLRSALPGAFIAGLSRPGVDQLLAGSDLLDEIHTFQPHGVMAPKRAASKIRGRAYDTALLLTNSFSTALITRLAFIPRRVGYSRDNRAMLLTDALSPPRNADKSWKLTPAVDYYWNLASHLLGEEPVDWSLHTPTDCVRVPLALPDGVSMELPVSDSDRTALAAMLEDAGIRPGARLAVLNPGGNNPAKRWPAERFSALADRLVGAHAMTVLINGSPAEAELCRSIRDGVDGSHRARVFVLPDMGGTLGTLKALCERAALMVTNDTGPRHIAAALGTPLVTMFGPTDPRWTTIPVQRLSDGSPSEIILVADPTLPPGESANDHPERCAVDRIQLDEVADTAAGLLTRSLAR